MYALISATEEGFKGKTGDSEFKVALDRADDAANGEVWSDGNWMAGFHFNSALYRISAVFDRLPKAVSAPHLTAADEYRQKTQRTWANTNAHAIREEVIILKHAAGGTWEGRLAGRETALSAVAELLELAETLTEPSRAERRTLGEPVTDDSETA